ncbi:hypothetical protein V8F20_003858 [Naviculisporaceae sp. PSN 640]
MATVLGKVMIDFVSHYWAPREDYCSPEAGANWSELVEAGNFTVWSRESRESRGSQRPASFDEAAASTLELDLPSMSVISGQGRVPIRRFSATEGAAAASYLGHNPGDHVFRVVTKVRHGEVKGRLKYEGQIPRAREENQQRLDVLLADVVDMAVCALSFLPGRKNHSLPWVPLYLQDIRGKGGRINKEDVDLLLALWKQKFSDWDQESGAEIETRSTYIIPRLVGRRSMEIITEAAFLVNKLQPCGDPCPWTPFIQLLEKMADQPFTKILRLHLDKMQNEGLEMVHGLRGSRDKVLVYINKEDIPPVDGMSQGSANEKKRRRLNKDAAESSSKRRRGADNNPAAAPGSRTLGAAEAAWAQLVRRHGWFEDPPRSSTFHQFYQQQQEHRQRQHDDRDFQVHRAGSGSSSSTTTQSIEQQGPSSSPDLPSPERLTHDLPTPPPDQDRDTQDTIVVQQRSSSPPSSSSSSSQTDNKSTSSSSSNRSGRRQYGDKGVAVPKTRTGRIPKRKSERKTSPKSKDTAAKFFIQ